MKRSPIKRTAFPKPDYPTLLALQIEKRKAGEEKPRTGQPRLKAGRRMKDWARVWAWLKPRLEAAGRTRCEFDHVPHVCSNILTPAHSKKRREMEGNEIYEVALACTNVHKLLDEKMSHEAMYVSVNYAIERAGGLILPAARKDLAA